jgi:hypothetical protein
MREINRRNSFCRNREMQSPGLLIVALCAGLALGSGIASAHHGRGSKYDMDSGFEVQGTIQELVWRNPHTAIIIDVPNDSGELVTWVIEHSNVSTLARQGYSRRALLPGEKVTAYVYPAIDGSPEGLCRHIIKEDGSVIFLRVDGATADREED